MVKKTYVGVKKVNDLRDRSGAEKALTYLLDEIKARGTMNIPDNARVMIKPNVCLVKGCETGATVDPFVVKCLVDWLLANYRIDEIAIGEADATQLNIDVAFKVLGWEETFQSYPKVRLLNLSRDEAVDVELNGLFFKTLKMSKTYMDADFFISVAKLKTHSTSGISCILKNNYGSNPVKFKAQYHPALDRVICDLNKARLPDLCLVDGLIGMEGEGPVLGVPRPAGLLIIGNDAVAVDNMCARVMMINPRKITYLGLARKHRLGSTQCEMFGDDWRQVRIKFRSIPVWKKSVTFLYYNRLLKAVLSLVAVRSGGKR